MANEINKADSGSIGWGILGFCIPLVGIILFFAWKSAKPNCSKVAGLGAIISVVLAVVIRVAANM